MEQSYAMTVRGPVRGNELGTTYVHEHLLVRPQSDDPKYRDYTLDDREKSARESEAFRRAGGRTLVEMTPIHYGRDVRGYQAISRAAGIHVICTTGFHKEEFMPPWFGERSEEELFEIVRREALEGIDGTGIRPGVVKCGTSYGTITELEEKSIRVAARANRELGIPISTHCDKGTMGLEQAELLKSLGVDLSRVLLCHIDSRMDVAYAMSLCSLGVNICIDHVGRELADRDRFRVEMIAQLVRAGFAGQVTLAGDMGKTSYLPAYGGKPGFAYILTDLKEELLKHISEADFRRLTVENSARIFAVYGA
ncbi:MAG: phosphotriesterase-related protein [Enterocloster asparagiformis]|nr:phosphotriesterase-related protein [Enterocloster asparagiformis]